MTVLAVLMVVAVLENTLPSFRWSYKIQDKKATVTVLTVLAGLTVVAVSVVTANPLNSTPLFCDPDFTGYDPVNPSNCSENSLVLFVRFFGFVSPFGLLT